MSWRPDMLWTTVDPMPWQTLRRPAPRWLGLLWLVLCLAPAGSTWAQGRYTPQGAAQRAWESGEQLRQAGDALRARNEEQAAREKYADAVEAFLDAKKADPAYIDVYVKLGVLYFTLERPKAALPILEAGLKRAASNVDLQFWYGQNLLAAGKAAEGVSQLSTLARRSDAYPEVHLVLGEHFYDTGAFAQAAPALERYLAIKPEATAARAKLGNAWFKLKLYGKALKAFETVRAAWPKKVAVRVNIGTSHYRLGQYRKAIVALKGALEQDPKEPNALFYLPQSHFKLGEFAAAKPLFERYVEQHPKSFNGHYFLGSTLMELGEKDAALSELAVAHRARPDIVQPIYKIGLIHLQARRSADARAALQTARRIEPDNPWVISALGTVERQNEKLRTALALHSEAAAKRPDEPRLQANLALTASAVGSLQVAEAAIDKALASGQADPWIRKAAVRVLALVAQAQLTEAPAAARQRIEQALALAPDEPHLVSARALARLATGDAKGALADAEKAAAARPDDLSIRSVLGRARLASGDGAGAVAPLQAVHAARGTAETAGNLGAALLAAGRIDEAITLLDEDKAWRSVPVVATNRALVRFARVIRDLPGGGAQRRIANDLRVVFGAEKSLPPIIAARARYAGAINALRRGDGREARAHLNQAQVFARAARKAEPDASWLRGGAGASHLDFLRAFADALMKRYDAVKERLAKRAGSLEKRLLRYVYGRVGALHVRKGELRQAKAAFDAALGLGKDPTIEHNRWVVLWRQRPKNKRVIAGWRALQSAVPEAIFNLGVAHEAAGDQKKAWQAFAAYARTGRAHAEAAREIADIKQRIYRFEEAQ